MDIRFLNVFQYFDEVLGIVKAVGAYLIHRDESQLTDEVTKELLSAIRDATGGDPSMIDEERLRKAVVEIVDTLEPLF